MRVVAITGDVGAGKSTAGRLLREATGAPLLDADRRAKRLWSDPSVRSAALARFGPDIYDPAGALRPSALADRLFRDEAAWRFAADLLHPRVLADLGRAVRALPSRLVLLEIPLLFEAGVPPWVDAVLHVGAPRGIRLARLAESRGWGEGELLRRERFLLPEAERARRADFLLDNGGTPEELTRRIGELGSLLLACSDLLEVRTWCTDPTEAERIGEAVVGEELAACANRSALESLYRYRGTVHRHGETELSLKTWGALFPALAGRIRALHSYETPAIVGAPLERADLRTALWILSNCRGAPRTEIPGVLGPFPCV